MGAIVADLDALHPQGCLFVAAIRRRYASWRWHYEHGYITYSHGPTTKLMEHRLVAELAHGVIPPGFHVHHCDSNPLNNAAGNLAVVSPAEHLKLHNPRMPRIGLACAACGRRFERRRRQVETRNPKYCSAACKVKAERKVIDLAPETLERLMRETKNWSELGRMFGVSDNAMRKWAKKFRLDLSVCDGRRK